MKRRTFIASTCAAGLASLAQSSHGGEAAAEGRVYLELRRYLLDDAEQAERIAQFYGQAAVPALNRAGVKPVGVFYADPADNEVDKGCPEEYHHDVFVLLPHASVESLVTLTQRLFADTEFTQGGASHLEVPRDNPAFERIESSLLLAFTHCPQVELPTQAESRIFQLRIYESHSEEFGQRKIEMFNEGGEIAIFRRTGLTPVFFGEALLGGKLPNLTYMVGFDDKAKGEAAWKTFIADPAWTELKAKERYKGTVSNITNIFLRPADGSQV